MTHSPVSTTITLKWSDGYFWHTKRKLSIFYRPAITEKRDRRVLRWYNEMSPEMLLPSKLISIGFTILSASMNLQGRRPLKTEVIPTLRLSSNQFENCHKVSRGTEFLRKTRLNVIHEYSLESALAQEQLVITRM